jgi:hypothetical protein
MSRDMLLVLLSAFLIFLANVKSFTESSPPRSATLMTHRWQMPRFHFQTRQHRLMHLEEEGKVKGSGGRDRRMERARLFCYKMSASPIGRARAFSLKLGRHHNLDSGLSKEERSHELHFMHTKTGGRAFSFDMEAHRGNHSSKKLRIDFLL